MERQESAKTPESPEDRFAKIIEEMVREDNPTQADYRSYTVAEHDSLPPITTVEANLIGHPSLELHMGGSWVGGFVLAPTDEGWRLMYYTGSEYSSQKTIHEVAPLIAEALVTSLERFRDKGVLRPVPIDLERRNNGE